MISIKTEAEIKILREGGRRLAQIVKKLTELVALGVTTDFLNTQAELMITSGTDNKGGHDRSAFLGYKPTGAPRKYPASLCVSINDQVVHGIPNEHPRVLNEGDIVSLDLGLIHNGLYTDHAWTVGVGKISADATKLLNVTKQSLMKGIKAARAGNTTGDIGYAIQSYIEGNSKPSFGIIEELTGHGVGYSVHEDPYVPNYGTPHQGVTLKPGMVIAIEPMCTLGSSAIKLEKDGYTFTTRDHSLSAHFEHTIAITKKEPIILTAL